MATDHSKWPQIHHEVKLKVNQTNNQIFHEFLQIKLEWIKWLEVKTEIFISIFSVSMSFHTKFMLNIIHRRRIKNYILLTKLQTLKLWPQSLFLTLMWKLFNHLIERFQYHSLIPNYFLKIYFFCCFINFLMPVNQYYLMHKF